jgi:hypothetical protein
MRIQSIVAVGVLVALSWTHTAHAAESYANCTGTVSALPTTISSSGTWCLKQNLATAAATGSAININADNVTVDCNDFAISGSAGTATNAIGIYALNRNNINVRHCTVQGFRYGVALLSTTSGGGHAVEDNRLMGNTYMGIRVDGDGSVVRRNLVLDTGTTTTSANVFGLYTSGSVNVVDNTVSGVAARVGSNGSAYGIYTINDPDGSIEGNRVRHIVHDGTGKDYGILNASSNRIALVGNDLFGAGSTGSVGMSCANSSGRAQDNVINGFATGLKTCGDAGRNDVSP